MTLCTLKASLTEKIVRMQGIEQRVARFVTSIATAKPDDI